MKLTIIAALLSVVLAGCSGSSSGGPSVSAKSSAGSSGAATLSVGETISVKTDDSTKISATTAGNRRYYASLRHINETAGISLEEFVESANYNRGDLTPVEGPLKRLGLGASSGTVSDAQKAAAREQVDKLAVKVAAKCPAYPRARKAEAYQLLADGDYKGARGAFFDYYYRSYIATGLLAAPFPRPAPNMTVETDLVSGERHFPDAELNAFLSGSMRLLDLSMQLQQQWGKELVKRIAIPDDDTACEAIAKLLWETPLEKLVNAAKRHPRTSNTKLKPETQALAPIEIALYDLGQRLRADGDGLALWQDSVQVFGGGLLNGVKTDLAAELSSGASTELRTGTERNAAANGSTASEATVGVGTK